MEGQARGVRSGGLGKPKLFAEGKIAFDEMVKMISSGEPSIGHCNTMGTALSMNALAEAVGMSLPGCAAIPAAHRDRSWMAYETGRRIVAMIDEDLRPSDILTKGAFENAVVAAAALGASSNCPPHMIAIARQAGVDHTLDDWDRLGPEIPLLVDCQPAGRFLGEAFYRAGGMPGLLRELLAAGKLNGDVMTVSGRTMAENLAQSASRTARSSGPIRRRSRRMPARSSCAAIFSTAP